MPLTISSLKSYLLADFLVKVNKEIIMYPFCLVEWTDKKFIIWGKDNNNIFQKSPWEPDVIGGHCPAQAGSW